MGHNDEQAKRLDERFKALAGNVSSSDWDKLIGATSERVLRRLSALGVFNDASPEQLGQALEVVGHSLVDYTNVAITSIAEGELKQELQP
jgi:hypothetical protein